MDTQNGGRGGRAEGGGEAGKDTNICANLKGNLIRRKRGREEGGENDIGMADSNTRD